MNADQLLERILNVLYTADGWDEPLTMERLHDLLGGILDERTVEMYGDSAVSS